VSNIYKLIEHLVNNWQNNLSEALSPRIKKELIDKFKQQVEDFDIKDINGKDITDEKLGEYIDLFDQRLKNSPVAKEKDITQYSLQSLLKLISSFKNIVKDKDEEVVEITPDIVYNENGLIIYNGSNEQNCLNFGRGEKWCITRGSFATYRYDQNRKNPTFYLVKDTNLPNTDSKSFFVVVVGSDNTYKVSDRSNNDVGGRATEWDRWEPWSFVERNFPSVRGLQRIFKYIPISTSEKISQQYKKQAMDIGEWLKAPFSFKEQYLVIRKGENLFLDISNEAFISKVLPKIPQIAEMISKNYGYVDVDLLLQGFDSFSPQNQKSIIANTSRFQKILPNIIPSDAYPFSAKKAVVKGRILEIPNDERYYITKDDKAIVKLKFNQGEVKMGIFTENESYPNVKVNERTGKVLADYPELDKIPFSLLVKLTTDNILPKTVVGQVLEKAKTDPNSAIVIKDTDEGQILLDSNTFKAYKIENGTFKPIPFEDDSVQNILTSEEGNNSFQDGVIRLLSQFNSITTVPMSTIISILKSTPYNGRIVNNDGESLVLLVDENNQIQAYRTENLLDNKVAVYSWESNGRFRSFGGTNSTESWKAYFDYLRSQNIAYNTRELENILSYSGGYYTGNKFAKANPPLSESNSYKIVEYEGVVYLVNRTNSRESKKISPKSGKLIKASINPRLAAQLLGTPLPTATPTATTGRRERPAGGTRQTAPAPPVPPITTQAGGQDPVVALVTQSGLTTGFNALPQGIRTRILNGSVTPINADRGATRRNNILGARGRVTGVITSGQSKLYIIRLASGRNIGSVAVQPGARFYIITDTTAFEIPSVSDLANILQQRNITEDAKAPVVHMYALNRPQELEEIKYLLQTLKK
jgi:hypothetical protein